MECLTDIRDGHAVVINRTRGFSVSSQNTVGFSKVFLSLLDVVNSLTFSPYTGGPITMDHDNTVKAYSASPSMLGRGHSLVEPQGPVWVRWLATKVHYYI
jgi:transcription factor C subunit 6